jgi:hypothetical protein
LNTTGLVGLLEVGEEEVIKNDRRKNRREGLYRERRGIKGVGDKPELTETKAASACALQAIYRDRCFHNGLCR